MTSDHTLEQSTSSPQGNSIGWGEVSLLPQNIWNNSQAAGFSGPGQMSNTLCPDRRMGVPSSSPPIFQFASSSLISALSPSISSSNPTPVRFQSDGAPQYSPGNCGSPSIDPGNAPADIDYDSINQDHLPADPEPCSISTVVDIPLNSVETHSPACFPAPRDSSNEHPSENGSIPNDAHPHANHLNLEVSCAAPTLSVSISPMSSAHDVVVANRTAIPETLVLEEAPGPVPPSRSEPLASSSKRGKQGFNYKLSSSLPVTLE